MISRVDFEKVWQAKRREYLDSIKEFVDCAEAEIDAQLVEHLPDPVHDSIPRCIIKVVVKFDPDVFGGYALSNIAQEVMKRYGDWSIKLDGATEGKIVFCFTNESKR